MDSSSEYNDSRVAAQFSSARPSESPPCGRGWGGGEAANGSQGRSTEHARLLARIHREPGDHRRADRPRPTSIHLHSRRRSRCSAQRNLPTGKAPPPRPSTQAAVADALLGERLGEPHTASPNSCFPATRINRSQTNSLDPLRHGPGRHGDGGDGCSRHARRHRDGVAPLRETQHAPMAWQGGPPVRLVKRRPRHEVRPDRRL